MSGWGCTPKQLAAPPAMAMACNSELPPFMPRAHTHNPHLEEQGGDCQREVHQHAAWMEKGEEGAQASHPTAVPLPVTMQRWLTAHAGLLHWRAAAPPPPRPRESRTRRRSVLPLPAPQRRQWPRSKLTATSFAPPARTGPGREEVARQSNRSHHECACWTHGAAFSVRFAFGFPPTCRPRSTRASVSTKAGIQK